MCYNKHKKKEVDFMENYKYKTEYNYDVNELVLINRHMHRVRRTITYVAFIVMVVALVYSFITYLSGNKELFAYIFIMLGLVLIYIGLISKHSVRGWRNRLLKQFPDYNSLVMTNLYYDEYIECKRTSNNVEGGSKIKYQHIKNCYQIKEELGYLLTVNKQVIIVTGDNTKEILEFVKNKINKK